MNSANARSPAKRAVTLDCPIEKVFRFWRDFKNLSEVFTNIREIKMISPTGMRWFAVAPIGMAIEWDAEIVAERPNKLIVWRSVNGSQLYQEGTVRFSPVTDGSGTRLTVSLHYGASNLNLARLLQQVFGDEPERELERDLSRFKERISSLEGDRLSLCKRSPIRVS